MHIKSDNLTDKHTMKENLVCSMSCAQINQKQCEVLGKTCLASQETWSESQAWDTPGTPDSQGWPPFNPMAVDADQQE